MNTITPRDDDPVARKAEIVSLLLSSGDEARAIIGGALTMRALPSSSADMLWQLASAPQGATLREIATALGRDPSTITLAADRLESAGITVRRPHPTDGRKRVLALTEDGEKLWTHLRDRLHDSGLFGDLTDDEQRSLLALLRRIR